MLAKLKQQKGFTLLEVLLVVAIIAILAGIVIIAINPGKQLGDSRNAQRKADVNTILNAVYQYALDNNGTLPGSITATPTPVCSTSTCTGFVDLSALTTDGKYLGAIPRDPQCATANSACYTIARDATTNRVTVAAPNAEQSVTISVTR